MQECTQQPGAHRALSLALSAVLALGLLGGAPARAESNYEKRQADLERRRQQLTSACASGCQAAAHVACIHTFCVQAREGSGQGRHHAAAGRAARHACSPATSRRGTHLLLRRWCAQSLPLSCTMSQAPALAAEPAKATPAEPAKAAAPELPAAAAPLPASTEPGTGSSSAERQASDASQCCWSHTS